MVSMGREFVHTGMESHDLSAWDQSNSCKRAL